jgi:hypothetical protein
MVSGNKPENRNEIQLFRFSFALLFISIFLRKGNILILLCRSEQS